MSIEGFRPKPPAEEAQEAPVQGPQTIDELRQALTDEQKGYLEGGPFNVDWLGEGLSHEAMQLLTPEEIGKMAEFVKGPRELGAERYNELYQELSTFAQGAFAQRYIDHE